MIYQQQNRNIIFFFNLDMKSSFVITPNLNTLRSYFFMIVGQQNN